MIRRRGGEGRAKKTDFLIGNGEQADEKHSLLSTWRDASEGRMRTSPM